MYQRERDTVRTLEGEMTVKTKLEKQLDVSFHPTRHPEIEKIQSSNPLNIHVLILQKRNTDLVNETKGQSG